jgi:hypothetical protein
MPRQARSSAGVSGRAMGKWVVVAMPTTIEPSDCMHNDIDQRCNAARQRRCVALAARSRYAAGASEVSESGVARSISRNTLATSSTDGGTSSIARST